MNALTLLMSLRRTGLLLLACVAIPAADPPPVPDPLGLGERLAIIDLLQETYHIHPAAGETLEQLQARYAAAWSKTQTPEQREDAELKERMQRLRRHISDNFGQVADPNLDEAGLIVLLRRLKNDAQNRASSAEQAIDPPRERRSTSPAPVAAAPPVERQPNVPSTEPASPPTVTVKRLTFTAEGVTDCLYWNDGPRALLVVKFGQDHNGAFAGIPEKTWGIVSRAKTAHRVVALLGHGNGTGIARNSIEDHLKVNRNFYETVGGQLPERKVECLLFGSCSAHNPDQMSVMRDGLGYYPTWKVAGGSRNLMNGAVFLAAFNTIIDLPENRPFRGFFRFTPSDVEVSSVGEVGLDGKRDEVSKWTVGIFATGGLSVTKNP
jgi:hypothetical protein